MTGRLQETLEETQRRLALGGVTTAPMMQTRDTAPRAPRNIVATVLGVIVLVALVALVALVGLFLLGLAVGDDDTGSAVQHSMLEMPARVDLG